MKLEAWIFLFPISQRGKIILEWRWQQLVAGERVFASSVDFSVPVLCPSWVLQYWWRPPLHQCPHILLHLLHLLIPPSCPLQFFHTTIDLKTYSERIARDCTGCPVSLSEFFLTITLSWFNFLNLSSTVISLTKAPDHSVTMIVVFSAWHGLMPKVLANWYIEQLGQIHITSLTNPYNNFDKDKQQQR